MKAKLFFIGAAAAAVCSCATVEKTKPQETFKPESFQIELEGNPTTGFSWECEDSSPGIVKIEKSTVFAAAEGDDGMKVGVPSKFVYKVTAARAGETILSFRYRRPWEKVPPAEERKFDIKVSKGGSIQKSELK